MAHHDKPGPRLNACTQLIHGTVIKWLHLATLVADNMVMVMGIIRVGRLIARISLRKVNSTGKPLRLKEVHKAISRDKIDWFWIRLGSDKFVRGGMQLNDRLRSLRFSEGCHQRFAGCRDTAATFLKPT
jgi:hypothetical protein